MFHFRYNISQFDDEKFSHAIEMDFYWVKNDIISFIERARYELVLNRLKWIVILKSWYKWEFIWSSLKKTGTFVLLWRRGSSVLTAGHLKITRDDRFKIVGDYNLQISNVKTQDAGDYICQIGDQETRDQVHTVEILGKLQYTNNYTRKQLHMKLLASQIIAKICNPLVFLFIWKCTYIFLQAALFLFFDCQLFLSFDCIEQHFWLIEK